MTCRLAVLVLAMNGFLAGSQSLVLQPGIEGSFNVPRRGPFRNLLDFRVEMRLHDFKGCPSNYTGIWDFGALHLRCFLAGGTQVNAADPAASVGAIVDLAGRTDVILRMQRIVASRSILLEVWNVDGSGYMITTRDGATEKAVDVTGTRVVGGETTAAKIAWVRWYSTTLPAGSPPPRNADRADLADWQLDGNGAEKLYGMNLKIRSRYEATPVLPPVALARVADAPLWAPEPTVRAGFPATLDGSDSTSFVDDGTLQFSWKQLSGPTTLKWSGESTAKPTVEGLAFGQYVVELHVTDAAGKQAARELTFGSVPTNDQGVVEYNDPNLYFLFGPQIRFGASPWPFHDQNHQALADVYGALVKDGKNIWAADWTRALAGTVQVKSGDPVVTGSGTQFQVDYCGGPGKTTPVGPYTIIVLWNGAQRQAAQVASCESQTRLTLAPGEANHLPTLARLPHSRTLNGAYWGGAVNGAGGSDNANYYDNVMAHYALYYRSGLVKYLEYARTLADRWYDSPFFLSGPYPRMWSLAGIMWRAYEGHKKDWWPRLLPKIDSLASGVRTRAKIGDVREDAYAVAFVAIAGRLTADKNRAAIYSQALRDAAKNRWLPQQNKGVWTNLTYGYSTWNGKRGTVSVTNGSKEVAGTNTTAGDVHPGSGWNASRVGDCFWIANPDGTGGDKEAYTVRGVRGPDRIELDRPYSGKTRSGSGWQMNNLCGEGVQPFQLGIAAVAWNYAFAVTSDPAMRKMVIDIGRWIANEGLLPSTKGLYYGRAFANCEPPSERNPHCSANPDSPQEIEASRFLSGEVLRGMAAAFHLSGDVAIQERADQLFGACLGKAGGPNAEKLYCRELDDVRNGSKPKDFGFFYGFSNVTAWPAVRSIKPAP